MNRVQCTCNLIAKINNVKDLDFYYKSFNNSNAQMTNIKYRRQIANPHQIQNLIVPKTVIYSAESAQ